MFVLDSSGSVGRGNFRKMKEFCVNIVKNWQVGPELTRFGE